MVEYFGLPRLALTATIAATAVGYRPTLDGPIFG